MLGGKNRVSEVLSGMRALTLGMVRSLRYSLGIPAELLVREPEVPYAVQRVRATEAETGTPRKRIKSKSASALKPLLQADLARMTVEAVSASGSAVDALQRQVFFFFQRR